MARRLSVIIPLLFVLGACAGGGTSPATAPAGATLAEVSPGAPSTVGSAGTPPATAILRSAGGSGSAGSTPSGSAAPLATAAEGEGEGDASDEDPAQDLPGLVLEAGGLGVITADTHITHLDFGTSAKRVRATVARLVGPLATHRRTCAGALRTVSTRHGFTVVAAGDRFVGWVDHGAPDRHLSTADGIAVGITVADLVAGGTEVTVHRAASGAVTWTSGPDGLSGRASGPAPNGRVTVVSSGEAC